MKIARWLADPLNGVNGEALVRVEPDEVADAEEMLRLVDGDSVGHFGLTVQLVATGETEPKIEPTKYRGKVIRGYFQAQVQFGFHCASGLRKDVRWYSIHVNRD